ncbi:hypothetical protein HOP50_02g19300 [Chloropicon primus]|nr:hypothetical protein HOP50_02g19300 [Chloropicon primus]
MAEQGAEEWVRKGREVREAVREHTPAVPVELVEYYAKKQGLSIKDPQVAKIIAASTEEFLGRVLGDALELTKKAQGQAGNVRKDGRPQDTLQLDILAKALKDSGINISGNQYL